MTDDKWERRKERAILAAFQTGRSVWADSDGELRYADGDQEPLAADVGMPKDSIPGASLMKRSWWTRVKRWIGGR